MIAGVMHLKSLRVFIIMRIVVYQNQAMWSVPESFMIKD